MCSARAHHPDGAGRVAEREVRALRQWQYAVCGELVHRVKQVAGPFRVAVSQQRQVDAVEREVAAEGNSPSRVSP